MTRLILTVLFICTAITLQAQSSVEDIRISEVFRRTPLSKALKTLETKCKISIAYDPARVQNIIVALKLKERTLSESLELLLEGTPLTFQNVGKNVIVVPRPTEPKENKTEKTAITLSGSVLDSDSEETLPQASIKVRGTNIYTTTNNDGYFTMLDIPGDTCSLEIRYMGYITQTIRVKDINQPNALSIKLKSDTKILDEVVVLDEYNQAMHIEEQSGTFIFNPSSVSSLPSLGELDISRTLQLLPGISATDESSAGAVIRGSHPSYNLTLLDGMTIYQQDHFFGSYSIINADIIKDVRVNKGMFDAKYGGRASGVIDITSKNGNAVKPAFNVKLNLLNVKATAEIPIGKKWSLFAGARRSFTDVAQSNLFDDLFNIARTLNDQIYVFRLIEGLEKLVTPKYYFFDANTKLTFRPSPHDIISLSYYISRDKMKISDSTAFEYDDPNPFYYKHDEATRWGNNGLSLRWGRQWSDKFYSNVRISDSKFFRQFENHQKYYGGVITAWTMHAEENDITDLTYAIDNEWLLNSNLSLDFGFSGVRQETNVIVKDELIYSNIPHDEIPEDYNIPEAENSWLHSLYGSVNLSATTRWTASLGARVVHYYNQEGQVYFEPRLTTRYKLTEHINLKAGYGRSNQFVTQQFSQFIPSKGSISATNENHWTLSQLDDVRYPVISSDHVSTGATLTTKQIVYDAEVYYKQSRGVIMDEDLNTGNMDAYGLDVTIQKTSGIHKGWIAYSLAQVTQTSPYINGGSSVLSWQDQRHELKVVDMLTLGQWNLSSTLIYGSGKPYQQYNVQYYYNEYDDLINYLVLDYSNQPRLPAYFRIDLAVSYKIRIKKSSEIEIGLSIHNVTNHENIKTRIVNELAILNTNELPVTYSDVVLLGFTPSLFLSVSF